MKVQMCNAFGVYAMRQHTTRQTVLPCVWERPAGPWGPQAWGVTPEGPWGAHELLTSSTDKTVQQLASLMQQHTAIHF